MRTSALFSLALVCLLLPSAALAADGDSTFGTILGTIGSLLNGLIALLITLGLVVFFWGLIKYLWGAGSEGSSDGLKIMFWGAIALFVMVSIWGIVKLIQNTFGVDETTITIPSVNYGGVGGVEYCDGGADEDCTTEY